jgi:hypothetical protein
MDTMVSIQGNLGHILITNFEPEIELQEPF